MMKYLYCIGLVVVSFVLLLTGCQSGDVDKEIETYDQLSEYYIKNNRPDSAVLVKLKTLELIDTLDRFYVPVLARTYNDLGDLFYNVAVFDKSREMYACALRYSVGLTDKSEESRARRGVWRSYAAEGKTTGDSVMEQAIRLVDRISSRKEIASLYNNLTGYFQYKGDIDSAFVYNEKAIASCTDSINQYRNYSVRSELFLSVGNYDSAWHYAHRAMLSPNVYTRAAALLRLSKVAEAQGSDSAANFLKNYLTVMDSIRNIKQADSIQAVLNRKQILSLQAESEKNETLLSVFLVAGAVFFAVLLFFFLQWRKRQNRKYDKARQEVRDQMEILRRLNDELSANKSQLKDYETKYSDSYEELLEKEHYMEQTFIGQLVSARSRCVETFRKRAIFRRLPALIEAGNGVLTVADREKLQETVTSDFALLFHPLSNFLKMSADDFFLYCLTISGLSTKECAACRGLTESAIRMQRKRLNDKIRSFFMDTSLLDDILL